MHHAGGPAKLEDLTPGVRASGVIVGQAVTSVNDSTQRVGVPCTATIGRGLWSAVQRVVAVIARKVEWRLNDKSTGCSVVAKASVGVCGRAR